MSLVPNIPKSIQALSGQAYYTELGKYLKAKKWNETFLEVSAKMVNARRPKGSPIITAGTLDEFIKASSEQITKTPFDAKKYSEALKSGCDFF